MATKTLTAAVQWWDSKSICVRCPFCDKNHKHGFSSSGYDDSYRVAHCDTRFHPVSNTYKLKYPFSASTGTTEYEIDKRNGKFVAIAASDDWIDYLRSSERLTSQSQAEEGFARLSLKSWKDAGEEIEVDGSADIVLRRLQEFFGVSMEPLRTTRITYVTNRMLVYWDVECVRVYCNDHSSQSNIFLHGISEDGNSALTLAACEKSPDFVELLLDYGVNIDFQNRDC